MILSGTILSLFAIAVLTVAVQPAIAGETDVVGGPVNEKPTVYLLKKVFDICDPDKGGAISGSDALPGGSMPPSGQQYGCVKLVGDRLNEYLFTGEQVGILVAVRSDNGAEDIVKADMSLDGDLKVKCNDITANEPNLELGAPSGKCAIDPARCWFGHDVSADLKAQPPAKTGGESNGFDPTFDKLYQCVYTATEDDQCPIDGVEVTVVAENQQGDTSESVPDQICFNPEVLVDVFTSDGAPVTFEDGTSGMTVYSTNTLKILNEAEGGVDLIVWLAGNDLASSTGGAKCPDSNILDVDKAMEFRCKIGTLFNNEWNLVDNPDDTRDCDLSDCQGADPLIGTAFPPILANMHTAECWFRLTYPTPCIGTFESPTSGGILIYARAI